MTRTTNARIAGFTFLLYIAAGITSLFVWGKAATGDDIETKLTSIAQHPTPVGVTILLLLTQAFCALILGVTLYALTRDQDRDLAMLGLVCRAAEGIIGGAGVATTPALVELVKTSSGNAADAAAMHVLGAHLLRGDVALTATFFAVGSLVFSWLFLRGRMIPMTLAWLGVIASALLVVTLPLQLAGFLHGLITQLQWLPMLAFEVPLAVWLMVKGVR
jgi:hypothetical protein